ncbi:MAG: DUF4886 domain-containing protein [Verrucomicrobiia bacterium]|jgi:hypothetical protein
MNSARINIAGLLSCALLSGATVSRAQNADVKPGVKGGPVTTGPVPIIKQLTNSAPMRVLFVGNSYLYYNDSLHNHVRRMAIGFHPEREQELAYKSATIGGSALSHHNLDSHLEPGKLGIDEPFELVILQGGSSAALSPARRAAFTAKAIEFDKKIRTTGAETALYMIHAYVRPHPRFEPDMLRKVEDMYVTTANQIGALVIPVGLAFEEAYRQKPELALHKTFDGTHPDMLGTYLAACVVYASIYGASPVGSTYDYFGQVSKEDALFLQTVARDTVQRFQARTATGATN